MSEQKPLIQIDDDWKRQAQEEKRKLAEQEAAKKQSAVAAPAPASLPETASPASRQAQEIPAASISSLVQSIATQVFYYLGELGHEGGEPMLNLDMAKFHIDTLTVLDEKCKGNLTPIEQNVLDQMLYESRMRFVAVAQQMIQ